MEVKTYEFTSAQNQLIGTLASRMKFVAIFFIVLASIAAIAGIASLPQGLVSIFVAVFYVLIGIWTIRAANSFKRIIDTEQSDISYLIDALNELKKLYTLQYVLVIIAIILFVIAILVGIIGGLSS